MREKKDCSRKTKIKDCMKSKTLSSFLISRLVTNSRWKTRSTIWSKSKAGSKHRLISCKENAKRSRREIVKLKERSTSWISNLGPANTWPPKLTLVLKTHELKSWGMNCPGNRFWLVKRKESIRICWRIHPREKFIHQICRHLTEIRKTQTLEATDPHHHLLALQAMTNYPNSSQKSATSKPCSNSNTSWTTKDKILVKFQPEHI